MTNKKKSIATLVAVVLATALTVPVAAAEVPTIRVSSYKGSTLEAGREKWPDHWPQRDGVHCHFQ